MDNIWRYEDLLDKGGKLKEEEVLEKAGFKKTGGAEHSYCPDMQRRKQQESEIKMRE